MCLGVKSSWAEGSWNLLLWLIQRGGSSKAPLGALLRFQLDCQDPLPADLCEGSWKCSCWRWILQFEDDWGEEGDAQRGFGAVSGSPRNPQAAEAL